MRTESSRRAFRKGARQGIPFAIAGFLLSVSFGVVAQDAGLSPLAAIVMSLIVFAGSAQFAAIAIVGGGGTVGAAIGAAALMNSRFLPMGAALGPSLPGGPAKRAAQGQAVVDASWALAGRGDGSFDRWLLFGATATQYVTWQLGTIAGALGGDLLGDPDKLGLDAIYPAFFLGLLLAEARTRRAVAVAALGRRHRARPGSIRAGRRADPGRERGRAGRAHALCPGGGCGGAGIRRSAALNAALLIGGCAVVTALLKAIGPIALGGRELPLWVTSVIVLLAPALLAALVFTQAVADGKDLAVGAETAGVVAGGLVAWRTGSIVACVIIAAVLTAALRAL